VLEVKTLLLGGEKSWEILEGKIWGVEKKLFVVRKILAGKLLALESMFRRVDEMAIRFQNN
jgi:hypothetical protein